MKDIPDISISFDPNLFVHTTRQIVGHYYNEYVEINENFENLTEDEYTHIMFAKANMTKSKEERNKIGKEYSENMKKYYPYKKKYRLLSVNDDISTLVGYILFKVDTIKQQYDLLLLDFISYNFNNLNDYYLFFINHFNYFANKLDKEDSDKIEFNTLYKINEIIQLSRNYYDKEINNIIKYQKLFKNCINFCYQIDTPVDLSKLTLQQRFFLFNELNKHPFNEISNKFETINLLDYTYDHIPYNSKAIEPKDILIVSSIIHTMDPEGTDLSSTYTFVTDTIFTAFYITLFNFIGINSLYIKICGNCNNYFIIPKLNVAYCDRIWDGKLTCKDVGSKLSQKRRESEDYIYKKYRNELSRKSMLVARNPDIPEYKTKYDKWKEKASKFWDNVKKGKKTPEDFEKWIEKNK